MQAGRGQDRQRHWPPVLTPPGGRSPLARGRALGKEIAGVHVLPLPNTLTVSPARPAGITRGGWCLRAAASIPPQVVRLPAGRRRCQGWPAASGWAGGLLPISSIKARTTSSTTAITMAVTAVGWPQNTKTSAARATAEMRSAFRCV